MPTLVDPSATRRPRDRAPVPPCAHRRLFLGAGLVIGLAALAGAVQLVSGTFTPPVSDLEPLGMHSWVLPGLWLLCSVAVPWVGVAWAAWRRHPRTPAVVLVACASLAVELVVQIPFVGLSALQVVMGVPAVVLAWVSRR